MKTFIPASMLVLVMAIAPVRAENASSCFPLPPTEWPAASDAPEAHMIVLGLHHELAPENMEVDISSLNSRHALCTAGAASARTRGSAVVSYSSRGGDQRHGRVAITE